MSGRETANNGRRRHGSLAVRNVTPRSRRRRGSLADGSVFVVLGFAAQKKRDSHVAAKSRSSE